MYLFVFLWSKSATTLRQDWTNTCVLEPCKNDASEREERKSPNPGKRSAKRSVRVYAANCDCVTCLSKFWESCDSQNRDSVPLRKVPNAILKRAASRLNRRSQKGTAARGRQKKSRQFALFQWHPKDPAVLKRLRHSSRGGKP